VSFLSAGYVAEVDNVDGAAWNALLQTIDDANLYQMWAHGVAKWGRENLSHLILKKDGVTVAIAQVTIVSVPMLGPRMAHVRSGPLWMLHRSEVSTDCYREMLKALQNEYCMRRGLLLRIKPWETAGEQQQLTAIRLSAGFVKQKHLRPYDTFVLDLDRSVDDIHAGLSQSWRRDLKRARKKNFTTRWSRELADFDVFLEIYRDMHARNSFSDLTDIHLLREMIAGLPEALRPVVMLCEDSDAVVSGVVFSIIGNRALALFGASTQSGLSQGASYVVNWAVVKWLKDDGRCRWYDLVGGLSKPGIRHFKAGLAKGCGEELHMSDYDTGGSTVTKLVVRTCEKLRPLHTFLYARVNRQNNAKH
jgi:hypothetical protein